MTSKEFIIWLRGFSKAANPYNVTPEQWDTIIEELSNVTDANPTTFNFGLTSTSTATTLPSGASINYTTDSKTLLND